MVCFVFFLNRSIGRRLKVILIIVVSRNVTFIIIGYCLGCFMLFFIFGNIVWVV